LGARRAHQHEAPPHPHGVWVRESCAHKKAPPVGGVQEERRRGKVVRVVEITGCVRCRLLAMCVSVSAALLGVDLGNVWEKGREKAGGWVSRMKVSPRLLRVSGVYVDGFGYVLARSTL